MVLGHRKNFAIEAAHFGAEGAVTSFRAVEGFAGWAGEEVG
jgi:hypothetical protein